MSKNKQYPYYDVPEPDNLKDLIDFCAEIYREKTAFWYKQKNDEITHSFVKTKDDIAAIGTYLLNNKYTYKHIAVLGENSYQWIVAYFSVVNTGNVVVPIDKEGTVEDIKKQLHIADVSLLLCSKMYSDVAEACGIDFVLFSDFSEIIEEGKAMIKNGDNAYADLTICNEATCAIVFTSGTTSEPKGVMLTQKNLMADAIISSRNLFVPEGTVSLLPFYHTFGFMACVICQMLRGYPVYINSSLKRAFNDIKLAKPKHVAVVPMLLIAIYNKIWDNIRKSGKEKIFTTAIAVSNLLLKVKIDLRKVLFKQVYEAFGGELEMLITGGSPIDPKYIDGFRDIGIKVINGYGITECSPIVATMRNEHYAPKSVGAVHPELEVRIIDDEVQIKGCTVFQGYYKNSAATSEAFDGEWFKTGDLGSVDTDGLLYITGRKKNLIILTNGKNVAPEELETLIENSISGVKEVLVYAEEDRIVAEVFPDYEISEVTSSIREEMKELNKLLPTFKQISNIRFRNTEFPKTTTKKIKRNYGGEDRAG